MNFTNRILSCLILRSAAIGQGKWWIKISYPPNTSLIMCAYIRAN